jgi:hypothetical protein
LMLDYGIFWVHSDGYFWDMDQKLFDCDVELFTNYALVITTNSGLWRYLIGDTVRFTSSVPHSGNGKNQTSHQCFWRRINGRKYRSGLPKL